jgi:hypothetical protein
MGMIVTFFVGLGIGWVFGTIATFIIIIRIYQRKKREIDDWIHFCELEEEE